MADNHKYESLSIEDMLAYIFDELSPEACQAMDVYLDKQVEEAALMESLLDYCLERGLQHRSAFERDIEHHLKALKKSLRESKVLAVFVEKYPHLFEEYKEPKIKSLNSLWLWGLVAASFALLITFFVYRSQTPPEPYMTKLSVQELLESFPPRLQSLTMGAGIDRDSVAYYLSLISHADSTSWEEALDYFSTQEVGLTDSLSFTYYRAHIHLKKGSYKQAQTLFASLSKNREAGTESREQWAADFYELIALIAIEDTDQAKSKGKLIIGNPVHPYSTKTKQLLEKLTD
ncbi:MAG: hypothetical protein AAF696_09565 [Bacteroidota bacterium]